MAMFPADALSAVLAPLSDADTPLNILCRVRYDASEEDSSCVTAQWRPMLLPI